MGLCNITAVSLAKLYEECIWLNALHISNKAAIPCYQRMYIIKMYGMDNKARAVRQCDTW